MKILLAPLYIITNFYFKTYDGTNIIYPLNIIRRISNNENITIFSYNVNFRNVNIGYQFIDISNITLSVITLKNYHIVNIPEVIGFILPQPLRINFFGGNKIFDNSISYNNNNYSLYSNTLNGIINQKMLLPYNVKNYDTTTIIALVSLSRIIGNDIVTISNYVANYQNFNAGNNIFITVLGILVGSNANNYYISSNGFGNILPANINPIFTIIHKMYDKIQNAIVNNYILPGLYTSDVGFVDISNYVALFRIYNVNQNTIIYINRKGITTTTCTTICTSNWNSIYNYIIRNSNSGIICSATVYPICYCSRTTTFIPFVIAKTKVTICSSKMSMNPITTLAAQNSHFCSNCRKSC